MADKKTYYKLDDIGFVDTQEKMSATSRKADTKRTSEIIQAKKSAKGFSILRSVRTKAANKL